MNIRVAVSGSGRMGRTVGEAVSAAADMQLVAYIDSLVPAGMLDATPLFESPQAAFSATSPDVVVDFTNAEWTPHLTGAAVAAGVRPVIGTSGLSPQYLESLASACRSAKLGGVVASNFALGAVLMMHFAKLAAPYFESAEIIELHHDQKVDAPSGTAVTTAQMMRAARDAAFSHRAPEKLTLPGSRGAESGGVAIHSVRLPGLVAHQEVLFGGLAQTLSIRHDSTGRDSFMPGVLLAVRAVMEKDRLIVGLDSLLGLS
jgi:4-hydroxy-tetrahydrodipicolinate reductase